VVSPLNSFGKREKQEPKEFSDSSSFEFFWQEGEGRKDSTLLFSVEFPLAEKQSFETEV